MAYNFNTQPQYQQQQAANNNMPQFQQQNIQPLFPQPQGNVYNINSTLEVANVPVSGGMSVALCLNEVWEIEIRGKLKNGILIEVTNMKISDQ